MGKEGGEWRRKGIDATDEREWMEGSGEMGEERRRKDAEDIYLLSDERKWMERGKDGVEKREK
jgi:hypothetical protein